MYCILINNPIRMHVELFAVCVHVRCVGLNCQHKRKKMHGGM